MKRLLVYAVLLTSAPAEEVTIESGPFRVERAFAATAVPDSATPIVVDPETWQDFTLKFILPHGSKVAAGETLLKFDRAGYDRRLKDARRELEIEELKLAIEETAFSGLEQETALKLASTRRSHEEAKGDLADFKSAGRKADEEAAAAVIQMHRVLLQQATEEIDDLRKSLEASDDGGDLRARLKPLEREASAAALELKQAEATAKRLVEVELPRREQALGDQSKAATIQWQTAEKNLPRTLEIARLELDGLRDSVEQLKKDFARLEADGAFMELKSPAKGVFFHGSSDEGAPNLNGPASILVEGDDVALDRAIARVVADGSKLSLASHVDEATARSLSPALKGSLTLLGREDLALSAHVQAIADRPDPDGLYRILLAPGNAEETAPGWPENFTPAAGMTFHCHFVVYEIDQAITVPLSALQGGTDGTWTVQVKLADGKSEDREVSRGRVSNSRVEILRGLEPGQVILLPD